MRLSQGLLLVGVIAGLSSAFNVNPVRNPIAGNVILFDMEPEVQYEQTGPKETQGNDVIEWLEKQPAMTALTAHVTGVRCDSNFFCLSGTTCCWTAYGWGCCPAPEAVCCDDRTHCCPKGFQCVVSTGQCRQENDVIEWLEKQPAMTALTTHVTGVRCDSNFFCLSGTTCCWTPYGWGCCPAPEAVCCDDRTHCCPKGFQCVVSTGQCRQGNDVIEWLEKQPAMTALTTHVTGVQCDNDYSCPDDNTCCESIDGNWACCPAPEAVCCDDKLHCCPNGFQCDVANGQCTQGQLSLPWMPKPWAKVARIP